MSANLGGGLRRRLRVLRQAQPGSRPPPPAPDLRVCGTPLPWIVETGDATFDAAVDTAVPVFVDLWAPSYGPCRPVAPILKDFAYQRAGRLEVVIVVVIVNGRRVARHSPLLRVPGDPSGPAVARQAGPSIVRSARCPLPPSSRWLDAHDSAHSTARPAYRGDDMEMACADCGCVVEHGVRVRTCGNASCCCIHVPVDAADPDATAGSLREGEQGRSE